MMSAFSYEYLAAADLSADKRGVDDPGSGRDPLWLVIEFLNRIVIASYDALIDRLLALAAACSEFAKSRGGISRSTASLAGEKITMDT